MEQPLFLLGDLVAQHLALEPPKHVRLEQRLQPEGGCRGAVAKGSLERLLLAKLARVEEVQQREELRGVVLDGGPRQQGKLVVAQAVDGRARA